jgi:hypothetical protein
MAFRDASQSHANDNHGSNTLDILVPSHVDGDVLVLVWSSPAGSAAMVNPSGWAATTVGNISGGASDVKLFTRVASSEPASYTLDVGGAQGQLAVMLSYSYTALTATQFSAADAHTASDDKTGAATTSGSAGGDDITNYQPIYYIISYDYESLTVPSTSVTPVSDITTRELVEKSDTEPANNTRDGMLWVGDATPLIIAGSVEPAWHVDWNWQANPPNSIGVKWTFMQAWFLLNTPPPVNPDPGSEGDPGGGTTSGGDGGHRQGAYEVKTALIHGKRRKVQIQVLPSQLNDQMLRE